MEITFFDEDEQRWLDQMQQERGNRDQTRLLNREGYSHPNDQNLQVYPERRDKQQRTEQIEIPWFDPTPITKAQKRKEELALRELGA